MFVRHGFLSIQFIHAKTSKGRVGQPGGQIPRFPFNIDPIKIIKGKMFLVPLREYPVGICQTHMLVTRIAVLPSKRAILRVFVQKSKVRMDLLAKTLGIQSQMLHGTGIFTYIYHKCMINVYGCFQK